MTPPASNFPAWHIWASEVLGVPPGAAATEARKAFLAKLEAANFAPQGELRLAHLLRSNEFETKRLSRALAAFQRSHDQIVHEEVEQFAERYWLLEPLSRQEEHRRLVIAAEEVPLAKLRLEWLRDGLTVEAVGKDEGDAVLVLAKQIQDSYILKPLERAVQVQKIVHSVCVREGKNEFDLLFKSYPEIGALAENFNSQMVVKGAKRKHKDWRSSKLMQSVRWESLTNAGRPLSAQLNKRTYVIIVVIVGLGITLGVLMGTLFNRQGSGSRKPSPSQNPNESIPWQLPPAK
jgi:hypothetical protein